MAQIATIDVDGDVNIEIIHDDVRFGIYFSPDLSAGGWWYIHRETPDMCGELSEKTLRLMRECISQNSTAEI